MNLIEVIGYLGADPEQRMTASGQKITTFRVSDRQKRGEREETIWWRITVWGNAYERLIPHLKKGSQVCVHGDIRKPEIYQDREGKSQISLELRAQIIRFIPGNRSERDDARPNQRGSGESAHNLGSHVEYSTPSEKPGGFTPGKGRSDYDFGTEDDQVPF